MPLNTIQANSQIILYIHRCLQSDGHADQTLGDAGGLALVWLGMGKKTFRTA